MIRLRAQHLAGPRRRARRSDHPHAPSACERERPLLVAALVVALAACSSESPSAPPGPVPMPPLRCTVTPPNLNPMDGGKIMLECVVQCRDAADNLWEGICLEGVSCACRYNGKLSSMTCNLGANEDGCTRGACCPGTSP
jgi:hypothetical protein